MSEEVKDVSAQGIFDILAAMDKELLDHVSKLIKSIDPDKVRSLMETIQQDENGKVRITIDLYVGK